MEGARGEDEAATTFVFLKGGTPDSRWDVPGAALGVDGDEDGDELGDVAEGGGKTMRDEAVEAVDDVEDARRYAVVAADATLPAATTLPEEVVVVGGGGRDGRVIGGAQTFAPATSVGVSELGRVLALFPERRTRGTIRNGGGITGGGA